MAFAVSLWVAPAQAESSVCRALIDISVSRHKKSPYNPEDRVDNCVACTSAFLQNVFGRKLISTAKSIEEAFGYAGRERSFNLGEALEYIQTATNSIASARPVAFMDSRAPSGHYVIFLGNHDTYFHVVSAWKTPAGRRFIYDAQIDRTFEVETQADWAAVLHEYGAIKGRPYHFAYEGP